MKILARTLKAVLIFIIIFSSSCSNSPNDLQPETQTTQMKFCNNIDKTRAIYSSEWDSENSLRIEKAEKEGLRERVDGLRSITPRGNIIAWQAKIEEIGGDTKKASLQVNLPCAASLIDRDILQGSPLTEKVMTFKKGDDAIIYGVLSPAMRAKVRPFREESITEAGFMREPEFEFTLMDIFGADDAPVGNAKKQLEASLEFG